MLAAVRETERFWNGAMGRGPQTSSSSSTIETDDRSVSAGGFRAFNSSPIVIVKLIPLIPSFAR